MRREYEELVKNMLTSEQAYKEWLTKRETPGGAPKDEAILKFYLEHHSYGLLTTYPSIVQYLAAQVLQGLGGRKYKTSANYHTFKGVAYLKRAEPDYAAALRCFAEAIQLDPSNLMAHYHSAFIYSKQFDFGKTCTHLINFMQQAQPERDTPLHDSIHTLSNIPQLATIAEEWGDEHRRSKNLKEAIPCYTLAKKLTPSANQKQYIVLCRKRGEIHLELGRDYGLQARFDFDRAIKYAEKGNRDFLPQLHGLRGKAYDLLGDHQEAINNYSVLLSYTNIDDAVKAKYLLRRSFCYEKINDGTHAVSDLESYLELNRKDEESRRKLATLQTKIQPQRPPEPSQATGREKKVRTPITLVLSLEKEEPDEIKNPQLERKKSPSGSPVVYSQKQMLMAPPSSPHEKDSPSAESSKSPPHAWQSIGFIPTPGSGPQ